jgi:hypothetical protein
MSIYKLISTLMFLVILYHAWGVYVILALAMFIWGVYENVQDLKNSVSAKRDA